MFLKGGRAERVAVGVSLVDRLVSDRSGLLQRLAGWSKLSGWNVFSFRLFDGMFLPGNLSSERSSTICRRKVSSDKQAVFVAHSLGKRGPRDASTSPRGIICNVKIQALETSC